MTGRLLTWLAEWLGAPLPTAADAVTWQLDSAWNWAPWATVLLLLAAILWTVWLYTHESSAAERWYRAILVALRLAALALVLVMLAEWALALRLTGPPAIALVIDRSASMNIADRYADAQLARRLGERLSGSGLGEPTRLNLAKLLATEDDGRLLRELAGRYRLEVYFAAAGIERNRNSADTAELVRAVRELSADGPESQATRLGEAVRHVLDDFRGTPPAAVILLSDGVTTEGVPLADAAQDARRKGVPLLAVGLGSDQPPRDIELADLLVDDVVFVNDLVSLQAQIKAAGLGGQPAQVTLQREGDSTPLAEQAITLPSAGQTLSVRLVDRPTKAGEVAYVVEVTPRDDETDKQNNRQRRVVAVRDEKIRVLLAYAYPSYEFRFLKTLLERDPTSQLFTYLQGADPEYAEQDKSALRTFPIGRDELFEYDVLVIGDVDPRLLPRSTWQNVREFVVQQGRGVAFIAGPRFLPWLYRDNPDVAALLPIDVEALDDVADNQLPETVTRGFVVRPTPLGSQSPALQLGDTPVETEQIWRDLAPLYWLVEVNKLKPGGQVWAEGPAIPVICFQYVGAGRVLFHAIDSTWRWRAGAGDTFFARYWVQTTRFLARGKLSGGRGAQLVTDRREYRYGEAVELRARFLDPRLAPGGDEVTVLLEAAGQARRRETLRRNPAAEGVFTGSVTDLANGQYEALLAEPQLPGTPPAARFTVVAPPGELARPIMDAAALSAAADATHGKFYTVADADRLLAELPAGRRVPIENLPPISIWNRWWLLTAFLIFLTTEWILRKHKGML